MNVLFQITDAQLWKETHTTASKNTSTIGTEIVVSQSPMSKFWRRVTIIDILSWNCVSRRSNKTSPVSFKLLSSVKWRFASGSLCPVCSRQLESPVTTASCTYSLTTQPGALKSCYFIMEAWISFYNGNMNQCLILAASGLIKFEWLNIKILFHAFKYEEYGLDSIEEFKMVAYLRDHEGGLTKFPCYICLCDSTDTALHYRRREWPQRTEFNVQRKKRQMEATFVLPESIFFSSTSFKFL